MCREYGKRRVVYSAARLSPAELRSIGRVEEELIYICGDLLFHAGRYHNTILVKEGLGCNSAIEAAYYAGKTTVFDDICVYCCDTEVVDTEDICQLRKDFGIVCLICHSCKQLRPIENSKCQKTKKRK